MATAALSRSLAHRGFRGSRRVDRRRLRGRRRRRWADGAYGRGFRRCRRGRLDEGLGLQRLWGCRAHDGLVTGEADLHGATPARPAVRRRRCGSYRRRVKDDEGPDQCSAIVLASRSTVGRRRSRPARAWQRGRRSRGLLEDAGERPPHFGDDGVELLGWSLAAWSCGAGRLRRSI